jgi:hypothetical protein
MYAQYVARLPANVSLESLGEDWQSQVVELREVTLRPREGAPDWLRGHPCNRTDWGTSIFELSAADLKRLAGIPGLDGERYAAVWVECY